jgi:hypothetical protein
MSEEYESKGLAMPFKGITTNGEVVPVYSRSSRAGFQPNQCAMPRRPSSPLSLRGLWPNLYLSSAVRGTGCVTGRVST